MMKIRILFCILPVDNRSVNMKVLVAGASGATGKLLVKQLLNLGLEVIVIVRSPDKLPVIYNTASK